MRRNSLVAGRQNAGFTLLEMLVVLVLAAIAATVVGSGAQSTMERSRYHKAIREVASQLNQARALCQGEGRSVAVTYQPESRRLLIDGRSPVHIPEPLQVQWNAVERTPKMTPVGEPIFVFNADGGARGGWLSVSRGGQGVVFRVNWLLSTIEQAATAP